MNKEEKELLFKDLCGRLPYKIISTSNRFDKSVLIGMDDDGATFSHMDNLGRTVYELLDIIDFDVKPYLRPMSSMTEKELDEYESIKGWKKEYELIDWLNKNHFDYRGLIPKGLAIAVTEENNPYEQNKL